VIEAHLRWRIDLPRTAGDERRWIELNLSADPLLLSASLCCELVEEFRVEGGHRVGRVARASVDSSPTHTARQSLEATIHEVLVCRAAGAICAGHVAGKTAEGFVYDLFWHGLETNRHFREWVLAHLPRLGEILELP